MGCGCERGDRKRGNGTRRDSRETYEAKELTLVPALDHLSDANFGLEWNASVCGCRRFAYD